MNIQSIALFCGSSEGNQPRYHDLAREFGEKCARNQITIIYGGANIGLMGIAAKAALDHHGHVIGIAPSFFSRGTVLAGDLPEMIMVDSMSERKQLFEQKADAFAILPGSYGTMDEFFEVITDAQLGLHTKPIAILNAFGYYDHLIAQLERFREDGFLRDFHFDLLIVADTVDALFEKMTAYENSNSRDWLDKIKS